MMNRILPAVLLCSFFVCTNYGAASSSFIEAGQKTLRDFVTIKTIRVPGKSRYYIPVASTFIGSWTERSVAGFVESDTDSDSFRKAGQLIEKGEKIYYQKRGDDAVSSDTLGEIADIRYNIVFFDRFLYMKSREGMRLDSIDRSDDDMNVPSIFLPSNIITMLTLLRSKELLTNNIQELLKLLEARGETAAVSHLAPILYFDKEAYMKCLQIC